MEYLVEFSNQIKNVVKSNIEYFIQEPILFDIVYHGEVTRYINGLDDFLGKIELQKKEVYNETIYRSRNSKKRKSK